MNDKDQLLPIRLSHSTFDPLREQPKFLSEVRVTEDKIDSSPKSFIVQFHKPLNIEEQKRLINQYNIRLETYIPEYAYLETITQTTVNQMRTDSLVRAIVPYHLEFKISSEIGKHSFKTDERKNLKGIWINTILFRNAKVNNILSTLDGIGAYDIKVIDDRKGGGSLQVRFVIDNKERLKDLAKMEELYWIEEVPERKDDNVRASGTIQSGAANNHSMWDQGIHGEGQIIGMIDSGPLDINHCFFLRSW